MHKKIIPLLIVFILIGSFSGCEKYDAPISSKTYDIKSFRIEDGKKIPIDPIFSKTVFEYEKEPEGKIDFVEWKPKPLIAKGELEQFFVEKISKTNESDSIKTVSNFGGACSTPEGWHISNGEDTYLLDPLTGKKEESFGNPWYFDKNSNKCIGRWTKGPLSYHTFACWDRISGHLYWNKATKSPKPIIFDNSLYYYDDYYREVINKLDLISGTKKFLLKENKPYTVLNWFCASTTDNIWFPLSRLNKEPYGKALVKYSISRDEAFITSISDIEDGFVYQDKYYYYNNKLQIYEVDKETMKSSLYIDMSKYLPNDTPLRESIMHTLDGDLLLIINYKKHIVVNMKTKKVFDPKGKVEYVFGRNIYFNNYQSDWGVDPEIWSINPETFEKSWRIKVPPNLMLPEVLLIDERGVLVRDEINLYGFRPKK